MRILILIFTTTFLISCNTENKSDSTKTDSIQGVETNIIEEQKFRNSNLKEIDNIDKPKVTESNFKYDATLELPVEHFYGQPFEAHYTANIEEYNASTTLLKKKDIENFYIDDLEIIRNLIYARHGYIFKSDNLKNIFINVAWYHPVYEDVSDKLTELELKNIDLIKRCEQYAKKWKYTR